MPQPGLSPRNPSEDGRAEDAPAPLGRLHRWLVMAAVASGIFLSTIDSSVVNLSLPTLTAALKTELATVEWVIVAYLLTIASLLLSLGRLSDMVGRRPLYLSGLATFTLSSLLCGLSGSISQLISFRVLQGVGAAMTMAISPAIVTAAFPPQERGKILGVVGTIVGVGLTVGPALGGIVTEYWGWRYIFFINLPVGGAGFILASRVLPRERGKELGLRQFDLKGAALLSGSLLALMLALSQSSRGSGGGLSLFALYVGSALGFILFFLIERRARTPLLERDLFADRAFASANTAGFINFIIIMGVIFLMPFTLEIVLGFNPAQAGRLLSVVPLTMMVVSPLSGWASDRVGSRHLCTGGLALMALSLLLLSDMGPESTASGLAARLSLLGLGVGIFQSPNNSTIMGTAGRSRLGAAAGTLATTRTLGMATGVALAGALFSSRLLSYLKPGASYRLVPGGVPLPAFHGALGDTLLILAALCAAACLLPLLGKRPPATRSP